ncbi:MAG: helix-turn-helix domain-containing protein [Candidatus Rokubacteria bacterium]|nr:helix-turn-helix domain-containing protein [Candidatus Rokubacteria bacterium]
MKLMTAKELARGLGISLGTVYKMVRTGKVRAIRIGTGRTLRFDPDEVRKALAEVPARPSPPRMGGEDSLLRIHQLAVETGIKDLAEHHDRYLYGLRAR